MKTRQEMIYEFMVALASNSKVAEGSITQYENLILKVAENLADEYYEYLRSKA